MIHKSDPWKKLRRINVTHAKKEFKLKILFKQKKLHARLLLPPFKYIIQESRCYLSTTTHCARVACELGERCSRCVSYYRCRQKHTCGVAVAIVGICLRGHEFESSWGHVYFFKF
jgi:hypothetical protein